MKLCTDVLYQNLSSHMQVECYGKPIHTLDLEPPVFWCEGMTYQDGKTYIGRSGELPEPIGSVACLLICVGGRFPSFWNASRCCVFSTASETNLFRVFNLLQEIFSRYEAWKDRLDQIVHTTADLEEMLRITSHLFGNSFGFCNKYLEVVACSSPDGRANSTLGTPLSEERVAKFADSHAQNIAMRELFTFSMDGVKSYCLNIFAQDSYQGLLTMSDDGSPITPGKVALFEFFFQYIRKAVIRRIKTGSSSTVTLKNIFYELITCVPVSPSKIAKALSGSRQENKKWLCLAAKPSKAMENLPIEYFCSQIEDTLPKSVAIPQEPYVIVFAPDDVFLSEGTLSQKLQQTVSRFFGYAGVSNVFCDLPDARFHYRQAVVALETAMDLIEKPVLCHFQDYALMYALRNSLGELSPEYIIPKGLLDLRAEDAREKDYSRWNTLKTYLDNEMNATQTARELYIHRTTLQNRLKNIENLIDLSTPRSRLYLRYGIYLYEIFDGFYK